MRCIACNGETNLMTIVMKEVAPVDWRTRSIAPTVHQVRAIMAEA
jgi:hypothetical protein